uniref:Odorant receptor n=1 Tax=Phlebotomus papatasi TaxID=29031 RepID=A0A3F2ZEG8_PHLPP
MSGQIYCFEDYLYLRELLNKYKSILLFMNFPLKSIQNYGKFIFLGYFTLISLLNTVSTIKPKENNVILFMNIIMLFGLIQLLSRLHSIVVQDEELNHVLEWIRTLYFVPNCNIMKNSAEFHLKNTFNTLKLISKLLSISYMTSIGFFIVKLLITNSIIFEFPQIAVSEENFWIRHILQTIFVATTGCVLIFTDLFVVSIPLYFIPALNILLDRIRNLDDYLAVNRKQNLILSLQIYHMQIIQNLNRYSNIIYNVFVIQFSTSFFLFLGTFYMLRKYQEFFLYPLTAGILFQFSAFCIFGEFIYGKTERLLTELYLTKWYTFSRNEQKILSMMMMMSQKPFGFKAAGMYDINLKMFVQVLKIAFTYCTILYTIT